MKAMLDTVARHRASGHGGVFSVCSAHPTVLDATFELCAAEGLDALVEATSNQVNQHGGYTGMRPADFRRMVLGRADRFGLDASRVHLGGDHLGPNAWRGESAAAAMAQAEVMVAHYVEAGFRKIHLDCSMACADDAPPLAEATIARRAARLAMAAETAWMARGGEPPVYVIGTEVPVPGGAHEALDSLTPTTPAAAQATLEMHAAAFADAGLHDAWRRVCALVVQPGVEFDLHKVIDYAPAAARALSRFVETQSGLVFEAHSTDYQTPAALAALVRDHFAILKVGPGLTYALREALWAMSRVQRAWLGARGVDLPTLMLEVMQADPAHWRGHVGDGPHLPLDLQFGLSDRIRYYWPHPLVRHACDRLAAAWDEQPPPPTLLSQFMPAAHAAWREGRLALDAASLQRHAVAQALRPYVRACAADVAHAAGAPPLDATPRRAVAMEMAR